LDKYEYKLKLEQIEKLVEKKDFAIAARIADEIDWHKIKDAETLNAIADLYENAERLDECMVILNVLYEQSKVRRRVVYRMTEVAAGMNDLERAKELYDEYVRLAPNNSGKYLLEYRIGRAEGQSADTLIGLLEEYKSREYDDCWAYELACLYEEVGEIDKCVEACDELALWFGEGVYVTKALELKMKYRELTATQQEKYERRFETLQEEEEEPEVENTPSEETVEVEEATVKTMEEEASSVEFEAEPEKADVEAEPEVPVEISDLEDNPFSTINIQEQLAESLRQLLEEEEVQEEEIPETKNADKAVMQESMDVVITQEFIPVKEPVWNLHTEEEVSETIQEVETSETVSETEELQSELSKYNEIPQSQTMDRYLSVDADGQVCLIVEKETEGTKQITGQLTIDDILEAWEEKQRKQEVLEEIPDLEDDLPLEIDAAEANIEDETEEPAEEEIIPFETEDTELTEEQEKIFAYFTSVKGMKKQLLTILNQEKMMRERDGSNAGNLVVTGHPGNGKTTLAIDIVKVLQKHRGVKGGTIVKVTGEGMTKKTPEDVLSKIGTGALIIERAGGMNRSTVENLLATMEKYTADVMVVLEDSTEEIFKIFAGHQEFAEKFPYRVNVPIFSNDELVSFGKSYAEEQEFYFEEKAVQALYDCIGVRQTAEHAVNVEEVKDMVDQVVTLAEKRGKKIWAKLFRKRVDENGNRLILEEDFKVLTK
jgi:DNA replication protein DnaC